MNRQRARRPSSSPPTSSSKGQPGDLPIVIVGRRELYPRLPPLITSPGGITMDGDNISFDDSVSRRKALFGAALGSAFALSVQPVQAQTMIVTPGDGIV